VGALPDVALPGSGWPPFPRALLASVRAAGSAEGLLQLGLWHGEVLTVRRIVEETEEGILAELEPTAGADRGPAIAAVPWHAIARVQWNPSVPRKGRPGFVP
jgi:hypothetical protein